MKEKVKYENDGEGIKEEGQGWTSVIKEKRWEIISKPTQGIHGPSVSKGPNHELNLGLN